MKTNVDRLLKFNAFIEYCINKGIKSITTQKGSDFERDIKEYIRTYNGAMCFNDDITYYSIHNIQITCENANISRDSVSI